MRQPTSVEFERLDEIRARGFAVGMVEVTRAALSKSTIDAPASFRQFLEAQLIHVYSGQQLGPDGKRLISAVIRTGHSDEVVPTRVSFYRPASRNSDGRFWIAGLQDHAGPNDLLALYMNEGILTTENVSRNRQAAEGCASSDSNEGVRSMDYWDALGSLWSRANGGADVAARPASTFKNNWPTAPRPSGVEAACEWFEAGLEDSVLPRMLFLVGGPGAGKSHAAAHIVRGLTETDPGDDGLAKRSYRYVTPNRGLLVVNDATIGDDGRKQFPLMHDVSNSVLDDLHLLACVNRGVLVEETTRSSHMRDETPAGIAVLNWLHRLRASETQSESRLEWSVETDTDADKAYIRTGRLYQGDVVVAQIVAVFVDVCSLFEPNPQVSVEQAGEFDLTVDAPDYVIGDFAKRARGEATSSPAGKLLRSVLEIVDGPDVLLREGELIDPFEANLQSLRSDVVQAGVLSILRAAEIAGSQRFTYRELWGAIARVVVGQAPERFSQTDLQSELVKLQPKSHDPVKRFAEIKELADFRFSQSLFGISGEASASELSFLRNPLTRLTYQVDPARDAVPGKYDSSWGSGWATPVEDAFAGPVDSGSPLESLISSVQLDDPLLATVTPFDYVVDRAFVAATQSSGLKDKERYALIAWYGGYLMRLFAVANGIPAFRKEITAWTRAWRMVPNLPEELEQQLHTLLRPVRYPGQANSSSLMPLYESRTNPVVGHVLQPKLALRAGHVEIITVREAESLFLELFEKNKTVARIVLDFALIREAMASASGHAGITELSDATSPRLERFRAARLVPRQLVGQQAYRVVSGAAETPLSTGGLS
jgi:hypothetical protein